MKKLKRKFNRKKQRSPISWGRHRRQPRRSRRTRSSSCRKSKTRRSCLEAASPRDPARPSS